MSLRTSSILVAQLVQNKQLQLFGSMTQTGFYRSGNAHDPFGVAAALQIVAGNFGGDGYRQTAFRNQGVGKPVVSGEGGGAAVAALEYDPGGIVLLTEELVADLAAFLAGVTQNKRLVPEILQGYIFLSVNFGAAAFHIGVVSGSHQHQPLGEHRLEVEVFGISRPADHREGKPLVQQAYGKIRGVHLMELDGNVGVALAKFRQNGGQHPLGAAGADADVDHTGVSALLGDVKEQILLGAQNFFGITQADLAGMGRSHAGGGVDKQTGAQLLLQLADIPGDGGTADVEELRSFLNRTAGNVFYKISKLCGIHTNTSGLEPMYS